MSRRLQRWRSEREADRTTVVVCRGGDCGSRRLQPQVDHAAQLQRFREVDGGNASVVVSRCLDACEHANVVVVVPGRRDATAGAQPLWVGEVLDGAVTEDLAAWVADGDLRAEPPEPVRARRFEPSRQSRYELGSAGRRRRAR